MSDGNIDRREFLKIASAASALMAPLPPALAAPARQLPNEKGPFDIVITGGRAIDPETGLDAVRNVGIKGGRIAAISDKPLKGAKVLKAEGQVVAPGFIDLHAHGQQLPAAWVQAYDGVTTALELESGLLPIGKFYADVAKEGRPINYGAGAAWTFGRVMVKEPAHGPADATLGWYQRAFALMNWQNSILTSEEMKQVLDYVETGLKEGAIGISINAGYAPGMGRKEYYELAKLAVKHNVGTYTHDRYMSIVEPLSAFEALGEQAGLAAITGAHMHICHLNSVAGRDIEDCAKLVKEAQAKGFNLTVGAYPYGAFATAIGADFLLGPQWKERFGVKDASAMEFNGQPLTQAKIDEMQKSSPGDAIVLHFLGDEDDPAMWKMLDQSVLYPGGAIESDGMPWTDKDGKILEGNVWPLPEGAFAHPRSSGCFSRFFARWVRERKMTSLPDAIRRCSLRPAQILESSVPQMKKKGRLQVGADADIIVFDPATIQDKGTFVAPAQLSVGFRHVVVNGVPIIVDTSRIASARPGKPVRRNV